MPFLKSRYPFLHCLVVGALFVSAPALALQDAEPAAEEALPEDEAPWVGETNGDRIRVRAGPTLNYRVLERLPKGSWVTVVGGRDDYLQVQLPGGVPVFMHGDLLEVETPDTLPCSGVVAKTDVLMRPTAGKDYFPLEGQKLQRGDVVTVLGSEKNDAGTWFRILPPDRVAYWIHKSLLNRVGKAADHSRDLERIRLQRRDGYTGGKEAEAAARAEAERETAFAAVVESAAKTLKETASDALPEDYQRIHGLLREVMTESGEPDTRARAAIVARDYLARERTVEIARAKAETASVKEELEKRLADVEARHEKALEELGKAEPRKRADDFDAVGTVRKTRDGWELVKGGVVLHRVDSLKYDLSEFVGLRVGVRGKEIDVQPGHQVFLLRVDHLEILE
ncbi:MAG: SH3 domain-containing protein [Planctomycetota bacterium]|jgi:uncharacterized protein YgiM (DUF1202 family)